MKVGLTFDLRDDYLRQGYSDEATAEFDSPETIRAIESALISQGHQPERIGNIRQLTERLAAGDRWDLVFNIAEGLHGFGREAQVPALLEAFEIPYTFSDSLTLALTLHKGLTKQVARDLGIPTADFALIRSPDDLTNVGIPFPLFAKPVAGGTSVGVSSSSVVRDAKALARTCLDLLERFRQPVLLEFFLPGREFTVGIVGTGPRARVLGVLEVLFTEASESGSYSYANKQDYQRRIRYELADDRAATEAAAQALRLWNALQCRDAGRVDFRCDEAGSVRFLEINPIAGLHPVHSDLVILCRLLGLSHADLIATIVASASERVPVRAPPQAGLAPAVNAD